MSDRVPNGGVIVNGQVWTAAQWNNAWTAKIDATAGYSLNQTLDNPTLNGATYTGTQNFTTLGVTGATTLSGGGSFGGTFTGSPILNWTPTWSGLQTFSGGAAITGGTLSGTFAGSPTLSGALTLSSTLSVASTGFFGGSGVAGQTVRIQCAVGNNGQLQFYKGGAGTGHRWDVTCQLAAESGLNAGSPLQIFAYSDTGVLTGTLFSGQRASGPYGTGSPYVDTLSPWRMTTSRATTPNGGIGPEINFSSTADHQPTATLGANPLSTTNGSAVVKITWTGSCATGGPIGDVTGTQNTWVNISGATAVAGLTISGWYEATPVDNDHFTINAGSNANATTTGGGSAVVVRPSFGTHLYQALSTTTTSASTFPIQSIGLYVVNPEWYVPSSASRGPNYQQWWTQFVTAPETSGTKRFLHIGWEADWINRGGDFGYAPVVNSAVNATVGMWLGAVPGVPSYAAGGGTTQNWGAGIVFGSNPNATNGLVGLYQALTVQPRSLVGGPMDPTSHGGVGLDLFGSYINFASNPFTTANGTSTVTVQAPSGSLVGQNNGDSVYFPNSYTINSVTFGAGSYTMASINTTTSTFTITGTGTASASGVGGGSGQYAFLATLTPYAPVQIGGKWAHGIISTGALFDSGAIIETQPGNGMAWNDGSGTASINAAEITAGNIDVTVTPAGTGRLKVNGGSSWTANGSVATALTSVGPTGSHTTVQEWFTVKNASGTVRYVPAF